MNYTAKIINSVMMMCSMDFPRAGGMAGVDVGFCVHLG